MEIKMKIEHKKPIFGVIEATLACNLKCIHCGSNAGCPKPNELSTTEMKDVIDQFADLGCVIMAFSGGEPLMRPDFFEIAEHVKKKGLEVSIISNGSLIDEKMAQKLEKLKPVALSISLDGIGKTHDTFRGIPGSFDRSVQALRTLKKTTVPHCTITTVTKSNFDQLEELFKLMLDLDVWTWQIQIGAPIGRFPKNLLLDMNEIQELSKFIAQARKKAKGKIEVVAADCIGYFADIGLREIDWAGCNAGLCLMSVTCDGNVKGCLSMPDSTIQGNVRKRKLKDIWENEFDFARNFDLRKLKGKCNGCQKAKECRAGCKAMSMAFGEMYEFPLCLR